MALLEASLLFQGSVVRFRATAADGIKIRALLSSVGPPLRLEIEDGRDGENGTEAVPLMASILAGKDKETPMVSRAVPFLLQSGGVSTLRLDNLLSELVGTIASDYAMISEAIAEYMIDRTIFRVYIHFAASRSDKASRLFSLPTVAIRAEGIDFSFTRELLCLHAEFFCALFYGSFAESGEDLVELETFTAEEMNILRRVIQRGLPAESSKRTILLRYAASMTAMTALGVADRVLFSSLKAKIMALPIPKNQKEKEEWLIGADKHGLTGIVHRIVLSIPQKDANEVHLKLFDEISNKEVHRLLLLRAAGKPMPSMRTDTVIAMIISGLGIVHVRLFADEYPEAVAELIKDHPYLWKDCDRDIYTSVGEVVDGVEILERPTERGGVMQCTIRVD